MRILHLLASPVFSGPAENVALLALAQRELGHEVSVAIDRKRVETTSEEPSAERLSALGLLDQGGLELSVKSWPMAIARDVWALRQRDVDVLHAHFTHDHVLARLARRENVRLVRSIHAPRSIRASLPKADAFTVPTVELASRLLPQRVMVLPPLIDSAFHPPGDRAGLQASLGLFGQPVIGMVSTFQPSRRHELALEAFALLRKDHPRAQLVLLGDGILEPQLRARAHSLGLADSVVFPGYHRGDAFVRWLQSFDQLWILGLGNDFSGRSAAQARACGIRVVAAHQGNLPRLADVVLEDETAEAIAAATRSSARQPTSLATNAEIAQQVLALYRSP
jgi:glycosyltransferase involved in cell wall biosynthesis